MIKLKELLKEEKLNEFNKAHFLNLIKQEIESLKGQIAYAKDKVNYKGTADWEKKEFKAVLKDKVKDLAKTIKHYKRVQKLKEGELNEAPSKPQVGDYFEDGRMVYGKIIKIDTFKGEKLIYVKPISGHLSKAVSTIQYAYKKLKSNFKTSKGEALWTPK